MAAARKKPLVFWFEFHRASRTWVLKRGRAISRHFWRRNYPNKKAALSQARLIVRGLGRDGAPVQLWGRNLDGKIKIEASHNCDSKRRKG